MNASLTTPPAVRAATAARTTIAAAPRRTIGGFELTQLLAAGRWSCLWRARPGDGPSAAHAPAGALGDYALKLPRTEDDAAEIACRMLHVEALLGQRVSHPHLAPVLASRCDAGGHYLVLPYLPGADLQQALALGQPLPLQHALWVTRQTAEALGALHAAEWLHGDVKPANVHVAPDGHATLLDLGLARPLAQPGSVGDRPRGGTLKYMAPEWYISSAKADQRSDLYSLGAILYELLAGRPPFAEEDAGRLVAAHLQQVPADVREFRREVPLPLARLLFRLLAKSPLRRPATAAEVADELSRIEIFALHELAA